MAVEEWGENEKRRVEKVGKENGGCFLCSYDRVGGEGRLLVFFYPVKGIWLIIKSVGVARRLVRGIVRKVVRAAGVSLFNSPVHFLRLENEHPTFEDTPHTHYPRQHSVV